MKNKTSFLFPVFLLIVIFSDEIFYGFLALTGISVESGMKSRMAIGIAAVGYVMMALDMAKGRLKSRNFKQLFVMMILLILYIITGFIFGGRNAKYTSYLLVFGSYCIPASYVGMRLAREWDIRQANKLLPYFVIPLTLVIGSNMGRYLAESTLVRGDESGLNYQSVSYFMSFFYSYSAYYCFFSEVDHKGFWKRLLFFAMLTNMFASALLCLLGGGRGAFVYIVAVTLYLVWSLYSSNKRHRGYILLLVGVISAVFLFLFMKLDVLDSAGMTRITEQLSVDDEREELWGKAMITFKESPIIGHGLGSIWWTVGFYCHNIVADLLAETGLLGTGVVLYVLFLMLFRLYRLYKLDKNFVFLILVFLSALVRSVFSGYWIAAHNLFFVYGFVFALNWNRDFNIKKV